MPGWVHEYLEQHGPGRTSEIAQWLVASQNATPDAARKRISRIPSDVHKLAGLLPKRELFLSLPGQHKEQRYWTRLRDALRASGSIYGVALDGVRARGGLVLEREFAVVSGASAVPRRGQLTADSISRSLLGHGLLRRLARPDGSVYLALVHSEFGSVDDKGVDARATVEKALLEGLREYARNVGFASFNKIRVRGEEDRVPVGPFLFDLAGPSYVIGVKGSGAQPGFFVADVLLGRTLGEFEVQFCARKLSQLNSLMKGGARVLGLLVAEGFSGPALRAGHAAGLAMATPGNLFGTRAGLALQSLTRTLADAARFATDPDRLARMVNDLADIEGASANLRGVLFELLAAYLARLDASSVDMGRKVRDPSSGETAEIDVLKVKHQAKSLVAIECKAKAPGGEVSDVEVREWLKKLRTIREGLSALGHREATLACELWTTGTFSADALELLIREQPRRTQTPISWKDGSEVLALATENKEKAVSDALKQHFIGHPLSRVARELDAEDFDNAL